MIILFIELAVIESYGYSKKFQNAKIKQEQRSGIDNDHLVEMTDVGWLTADLKWMMWDLDPAI